MDYQEQRSKMTNFGYVITEYEKVKAGFPEYQRVMTALREQLIAKAEADWSPLTYAGRGKMAFTVLGVSPGPGLNIASRTFGESTIIPALFANRLGTRLVTWDQWYGAPGLGFTIPGDNIVIQGAASGATIAEDYKIGLAGLVFLDKAIRISEIKMQVSDKKFPRINIEEAFGYNKPAIVFEEGVILDEETGYDMHGYILTNGPQRIKLLGFQLNRIYDKMLTNTGSALT